MSKTMYFPVNSPQSTISGQLMEDCPLSPCFLKLSKITQSKTQFNCPGDTCGLIRKKSNMPSQKTHEWKWNKANIIPYFQSSLYSLRDIIFVKQNLLTSLNISNSQSQKLSRYLRSTWRALKSIKIKALNSDSKHSKHMEIRNSVEN